MAFAPLPQRQKGTLQNIGLGLQAFGAGIQGRGPEFLALQQQQQKQVSLERRKAAADDIRRAKLLFDQGRISEIRQLADERIGLIQQLGGDPSDSALIRDLAQAAEIGDADSLRALGQELDIGVQAAVDAGIIEAPTPLSPAGMLAEDVRRGIVSPGTAAAQTDIQKRRLELARDVEERQAQKLSAPAEKLLIASQDATQKLSREANTFDNLADEFNRVEEAGIQAKFSEGLKNFLGTQDDVTTLRRQYNAIRSSQAVKNLPPGVASDKDIELALRGFPDDTANPAEIQSFLRGAAKVARADAAWNQFRADFISRNRNTRNLGREWRRKIDAPGLGREVSMGEVYITAQNRGLTPEEVMEQLGLN